MDQLIPVINRLQDVLLAIGVPCASPASSSSSFSAIIDLPQIAVVGAQSVGKSSVLESLVGKDFLPRGTGIVTRRPIILQLRNVTANSNNNNLSEWGEFAHTPGHVFADFDQIKKEIERETERITGRNKNISSQPIILKIFSPNVIDLTLIDLPGITKVPIGDQPTDIELQIRRIIFQYISKSNCIILAVTAANTDLANSDSLKIAREVDPEGVRTVGVITKCDTLEGDGTDAMDMLCGKIYPLKRGYVGVVCRSQRGIQDKKNIQESLKDEEKFFRSHPAYRNIAHRCGSKYLALTLNQILMYHIRDSLPELKGRILQLLHETEAELGGYGDAILEAKGNPGALLLHFFSKFARNFQDAIDGKLSSYSTGVNPSSCSSSSLQSSSSLSDMLSNQLHGGARINYIFHDWFARHICEFNPLDGLSDHEIRTAIRNATGPKAALFVPEGAFEILVKKQIQQLETPALQCVDQVYEELQKIVEKCELPEMSRFTNLRDKILDVVRGVLKKCLAPTNQMVHNLIQIELAYINTNHMDFMNNRSFPNVLCGGSERESYPSGYRRHPSGSFSSASSSSSLLHITNNGSNSNSSNTGSSNSNTNNVTSSENRRSLPGLTVTAASNNINNSNGNSNSNEKLHPNALSSNNSNSLSNTNPVHSDVNSQAILQHSGFFSFLKGSRTPPRPELSSQVPTAASGAAPPPPPPPNPPNASQPSVHMNSNASNANSSVHRSVPPVNGARTTSLYMLPRNNNVLSSCAPVVGAGGSIRLPQVPSIVAPSEMPSEREIIETDLIKSLIWSYFNIVRKNIIDAVPKSIMYFMVNTAKDVIQRELVSQLYREELFGELLKEADDVAERRMRCKEMLKSLRNSLDILSQLRDFNTED